MKCQSHRYVPPDQLPATALPTTAQPSSGRGGVGREDVCGVAGEKCRLAVSSVSFGTSPMAMMASSAYINGHLAATMNEWDASFSAGWQGAVLGAMLSGTRTPCHPRIARDAKT